MFNDLDALKHTLIVGSLGYLAVIALLRIVGKRTLSKLNAFDFVSTIAYGSVLANIVLSKDTSLLQGILGLSVLLAIQYVFTWLAARTQFVQQLIKTQPVALLVDGEFQTNLMQQQRVAKGEVFSAVRSKGFSSLEEIKAVVLETDGSLSVISKVEGSGSAMVDVQGFDRIERSAS